MSPKESSVKTAKAGEETKKEEEKNETPTEEKVTDGSITVVVHPLVLLSVVDHFNRMGKIGNQKRVVGVLLGKFMIFLWSSFKIRDRCAANSILLRALLEILFPLQIFFVKLKKK